MLNQALVVEARPDLKPIAAASRAPASPFSGIPELLLTEHKYGADEEIFGEGEPAEYSYQVVRGAVRTYKVLNDGRRQISAFHLPGDLFGLSCGGQHRVAADAIVNVTVRLVKRRALDAASRTNPQLACSLWAATVNDLRHAEDHITLLGRKSATQRVATFILEMDRRLANTGFVHLPMPRRDIGDYLGLTIETVSRTITQLQDEGALELTGARNIRLSGRQALEILSN